MIRQSSIALAELIAVANPAFRPTQIIEGLNGVSHGLEPYGPDFRSELVAVTGSDEAEHTEILGAAGNRLGEIIRGALDNISAYGKPLAMAIGRNAEVCYSQDHLRGIAVQYFKHQFIWLDDPFFDSSAYPTEVKDKSFAYTNVGLDVLSRLEFEYPTNDQVLAFVNSNHADVVEIMRERDTAAARAANCLTDLESLDSLFVKSPNGNFDFSRVKQLDSERILKMYVILTKMYTSEDLVPWLKGGSIEDYRAFVNTMWNALTCHMVNLRAVIQGYRANGLTIVDNGPVRLVDGKGAEQAGARFVEADAMVFYTDKAMDAITQGGNGSLSECLLGWYWSRLLGTTESVGSIVAAPGQYMAKVREYYNHVNEKLSVHAKETFIKTGLAAIAEFIVTNENLSGRLAEVRGQSSDLLGTWVRNNFAKELEVCFRGILGSGHNFDGAIDENDTGGSLTGHVMASQIVPKFLSLLKCDLAAEILTRTYQECATNATPEQQRERLTVAVIQTIVGMCLE